MSRTTTFVSTARMPLSYVSANSVLHISDIRHLRLLRKERLMNIFGCITPSPAYDYLIVLFIPFQHGSGPHTQFLSDFRGDGYLALCRQFGFCNAHGFTLPR